jgi:hypothetical protein
MRDADLPELLKMRAAAAALTLQDSRYSPLFDRFDRMVTDAKAARRNVSKARMIVRRERDKRDLI